MGPKFYLIITNKETNRQSWSHREPSRKSSSSGVSFSNPLHKNEDSIMSQFGLERSIKPVGDTSEIMRLRKADVKVMKSNIDDENSTQNEEKVSFDDEKRVTCLKEIIDIHEN